MYMPTQPVIFSRISKHMGGSGRYELLLSNGSYLRSPDGHSFGRISRKLPHVIYRCEMDQRCYIGSITDAELVERTVEYMGRYHGKRYTNCSSFAHFLTTGTFIECSVEHNLLVLEQGMRVYSGQKADVGDMVCIIFANQDHLRSRKSRQRRAYLEAEKGRRLDGRFSNSLTASKEAFTAEELRGICRNIYSHDYHFMVCVGKQHGQPVWIAQWGRFDPIDADGHAPLILTVGEQDGYAYEVPLLTFIKKRRAAG
jgi:hypothetical protein